MSSSSRKKSQKRSGPAELITILHKKVTKIVLKLRDYHLVISFERIYHIKSMISCKSPKNLGHDRIFVKFQVLFVQNSDKLGRTLSFLRFFSMPTIAVLYRSFWHKNRRSDISRKKMAGGISKKVFLRFWPVNLRLRRSNIYIWNQLDKLDKTALAV